MSTRYNNNKRKFGKRMANRIEYDIENGKSPTAATAKAMALESVQSVVLAIGTQAVLSVGPSVIKSGKNLVNSALNNMYNTSVETPDGKTIARYNQKYNF